MKRRSFLSLLLGLPFLAIMKSRQEQPKTDPHLNKQLIGCIVGQDGKSEYIYGHYDWCSLNGVIYDYKSKTWKSVKIREELI